MKWIIAMLSVQRHMNCAREFGNNNSDGKSSRRNKPIHIAKDIVGSWCVTTARWI